MTSPSHHQPQVAKATMAPGLKKPDKAPPKVVLRNAAVQAVGERYFQVSLVGLVTAGVLAIVAVSIGERV